MLPEHQTMTPEERLAAGRCPECAVLLKGLDLFAHRAAHWLELPTDLREHQEARRRWQMLTAYAEKLLKQAAKES